MKDQETQDRFVFMRSQGKTFDDISQQLGVSTGCLINWSRKYRFQIQNFRAIELENLRSKLISTSEARARALSEELQRVQQELKKRNLADIPTARLYSLEESLRRQVLQELGEMQFTSSTRDIPGDEYVEQVQDWKP
jgi:transposase